MIFIEVQNLDVSYRISCSDTGDTSGLGYQIFTLYFVTLSQHQIHCKSLYVLVLPSYITMMSFILRSKAILIVFWKCTDWMIQMRYRQLNGKFVEVLCRYYNVIYILLQYKVISLSLHTTYYGMHAVNLQHKIQEHAHDTATIHLSWQIYLIFSCQFLVFLPSFIWHLLVHSWSIPSRMTNST